ncbi:MAG: AsmA family protein, partial [Verrucomicrobiae bacterium]|nr:AsmA family protein [Verrucomicrobiae bacterium]
LGADLTPGQVSGGASLAVLSASGSFSNFDALGATLNCDVTPTEIKQLALQFQKSGGSLGSLSVAGPFDAQKLAGKLTVKLDGIDRRLLNLAGTSGGLDFGTTTVNATTEIQLAGGGAEISAAGKFNAAQVQVTRAGQTTPVLDLAVSYDVRLDRAAQTATVHSLDLTATQNGAPLLNAQLSSPMNLAWGGNATNAGDAALNLAVTQLNLADWKPFLGDAVSTGTVGLKLQVSSHDSGKQLTFDVQSDISNLAVQAGSNRISQAGINLSARGQLAQFKQVVLDAYKLEVTLKQQPALSVSGSGSYDLSTQDADLQVQLKAMLAVLMQVAPQAGFDISAGSVELNGRVGQKQKTQTVAGQLALNDFSAQIGQHAFLNYSGKFDVDVANAPEKIQVNKFAGSFSQNGSTGGSFEVAGGFKPGDKSADLAVKFAGLNAHALRPFLEPVLAGKTLSSVEISGDVSGQYQPGASSAVKADLNVSNLVVKDPLQQLPATPLSAGFKLDVAISQQTADIHQFQIALTPTSRATNQLQFSGQVNFASPFQGNLKLAADSLDVTRYYDLFAGGTNAAKPAAASVAANTNEEPAAVKLPVKNFTLAVELGRFYLHEVAITNFQTTVNLETSHVVVKPLQLSLNGAPVSASADVDLSVPGYKYDIAFDAQAVPLTPLLNTFVPARAGQLGGTVTASAQIKGAGFSGANLKKNLSGQFSFNATNLNLSMKNIKNPIMRLIVNA